MVLPTLTGKGPFLYVLGKEGEGPLHMCLGKGEGPLYMFLGKEGPLHTYLEREEVFANAAQLLYTLHVFMYKAYDCQMSFSLHPVFHTLHSTSSCLSLPFS